MEYIRWFEAFGNKRLTVNTYLSKQSLLNASLDTPRKLGIVVDRQRSSDDRRRYVLTRVDYLLDSRDAERDVHGSHAGKVKRLERHLGAGFADALAGEGADGRARLDPGLEVLFSARLDEPDQLVDRQPLHLGVTSARRFFVRATAFDHDVLL